MQPFKSERTQRVVSVIVMVIGLLLLVTENVQSINFFGWKMNLAILGVLLMLGGAIYLIEG